MEMQRVHIQPFFDYVSEYLKEGNRIALDDRKSQRNKTIMIIITMMMMIMMMTMIAASTTSLLFFTRLYQLSLIYLGSEQSDEAWSITL